MTSQKLENLLNLALNSAEDEREKSLNLNVGYDPLDREWDLIIKYSVNLDRVRKIASKVTELQNEYAVIRITESRIDILSGIPEVEYVEKPKRLFFQAAEGRRVSCINAVQDTRLSLYGQGILVAIIDSGIDYANIDFRNADGSTRIRYLWDQSLNPADGETAPAGYSIAKDVKFTITDELKAAETVTMKDAAIEAVINTHQNSMFIGFKSFGSKGASDTFTFNISRSRFKIGIKNFRNRNTR